MTVSVTDPDLDVDTEDMSLAQWEEFHDEHKHELVAGVLVMSPAESIGNRRTVARLASLISPLPGVEWVSDADVLLAGDSSRPTVRCPDLLVFRAGAVTDGPRFDPVDLLLVVEVVSPGSRETDWATKRAEYATAGIPAYLVVDRHRSRIALFDAPTQGRYTRRATGRVTLDLAGQTLTLSLADVTV